MGDYCEGIFVAPNFGTHYRPISVRGKPQPLFSILAHEFAEWTLWASAIFRNKTGFEVTAVFSIDKFPIGKLELASVVFAQLSVFAIFSA